MYRVRKKNIAKKPAIAEQPCRVGRGQPLDPEDREGHEWVAAATLVEHERERGISAGGRERSRSFARLAPADVGGLDQRVDEQQHAAGGQERAGRVEVGKRRALALAG